MFVLRRFLTKDHRHKLRKMRYQTIRSDLIRLSVLLFAFIFLHTLAMMIFEGLTAGDSLWLTITTATTVGYGDFSAKSSAGRLSTVILMYIGGIALLTQVAVVYFDYRQMIKNQMMYGKWRWYMQDHIVILNCPIEHGMLYFEKALLELRKSVLDTAQKPVIVVSDKLENGLSHELRNLDVAHVSRAVAEPGALEDASIDTAGLIVILSQNMHDPISDSLNFDLIHKIRERGVKSLIIAEMLNDENKDRALKAGANHVIRPIRSYPELLVRTILAPGTEQFVEDLFDAEGEECIRYEIKISGQWGQLSCKMIEKDIGTPLAFLGLDNRVVCNAHPDEKIEAQAVFVLVREGNLKKHAEVQKCLQN